MYCPSLITVGNSHTPENSYKEVCDSYGFYNVVDHSDNISDRTMMSLLRTIFWTLDKVLPFYT